LTGTKKIGRYREEFIMGRQRKNLERRVNNASEDDTIEQSKKGPPISSSLSNPFNELETV
jgi:hypothetical protein